METGRDNPYLPQEVISNILKRLPVKSLIRFNSVCKNWRNLFKSFFFIEENYNYSAHNNPLLICRVKNYGYWQLCFLRYEKETDEIEIIPGMMDSLKRVCGIIGSSNGLICVKLAFPSSLLLLNPITREVRQVPKPTNNNDDGDNYYGFQWGFGYSPIVKDYKIVSIHGARINEEAPLGFIRIDQVEVFSLRTCSWKEVDFGITRSSSIHSNPIAVNGAIFWLGSVPVEEVGDPCGMIISFDVATEVFTLRPLPFPTSISSIHKIVLDVYENKVALLHQYHTNGKTCINLWVLEEGSDSHGMSFGWTKKYSIRSCLPYLLPKCLWRNEIVCYNLLIDDTLFLFNVHATHNKSRRLHSSFGYYLRPESFFYAESLAFMSNIY